MKPYYEHGGITIYHGDCREILPRLAADLILTDAPYGTGGWRRVASGNGSDPSASLVKEAWDSNATDWLALCPAAAPILTFWSAAYAQYLLPAAAATGRDKHRTIYMRKRDPMPMPKGRTAWSVEPIWVLSAAGFTLSGGDDLIDVSTPRLGRDHEALGHPYQKPLEAMAWALSKCQGETVLDPFMGSGTTLRAAKDLGWKAIGIELDEHWCEVAAKRLSQEVLPLGLSSDRDLP